VGADNASLKHGAILANDQVGVFGLGFEAAVIEGALHLQYRPRAGLLLTGGHNREDYVIGQHTGIVVIGFKIARDDLAAVFYRHD
jgi:hypothetical protein